MSKPKRANTLQPLIDELRICKEIEDAARTDLEWCEHRLKMVTDLVRKAKRDREVAAFALTEAIDAMTRSPIADELA